MRYWYLQVISLWTRNYLPISSPIHFFPADIRTQGCGQPVSVEKRAPASAYWDTKVVIINSRNNPETTTLPFESWVMGQDVWRIYSAQKDYIIYMCVYIYIYMYTYIYIYIFTVTYINIHIYVYIYTYMYIMYTMYIYIHTLLSYPFLIVRDNWMILEVWTVPEGGREKNQTVKVWLLSEEGRNFEGNSKDLAL